LIEECRKSLQKEKLERRVRLVVADARDLSQVAEGDFDVDTLQNFPRLLPFTKPLDSKP
jgi:hypothetical protein